MNTNLLTHIVISTSEFSWLLDPDSTFYNCVYFIGPSTIIGTHDYYKSRMEKAVEKCLHC